MAEIHRLWGSVAQQAERTRQTWSPLYPKNILQRPPPPRWIWDGLIMRGLVTVLAGDPKVGKSLLLQQILSAAALELPCLGRATEKTNSFGYFCEDPDDRLSARQFDINVALGCDMPDYDEGYSWQSRAIGDCILVNFDRNGRIEFTDEWRMLWQHVADDRCRLVGIDTAAAVFNGNENSRNQVTQFLRALAAKAIEIDGAVILNAHPPKGNPRGISGTNAWLASARSGIALFRPPEYDDITGEPRDERLLSGLGSNYSARMGAMRLYWQDGVFQPADPTPPVSPTTTVDKMDLDYRLLAGLRRAVLNGAQVQADELAQGSLPRRARTAPDLARVPLNALYDAQARLIDRGQIIRVLVGGKCLIRLADGKPYVGESPWSIL